MKSHLYLIILTFLPLAFPIGLSGQTETNLPVDLLGTGGQYGIDVCMEAEYLIVGGGPGIIFPSNPNPQASIFEQKNGIWEPAGRLTPSDSATAGSGFGLATCISKGTHTYAFVGAPDDSDPNLQAGAVYVFEREDAGPWIESAKLKAGDPQNKAGMGLSVAADDEYMITGAPLFEVNSAGSSDNGKAYIFQRESATGSWLQDTSFIAPTTNPHANYGTSVSINMPYAIVGSNMGDSLGPDQYGGTAFIYERKASGWETSQKLVPSIRSGIAQFGEQFGNSVDIDGDYAVVGAHGFTTATNPHGAAFVFEKTTSEWVEMAILIPSDSQASGEFGYDVAIHGGAIAVGARGTRDVGASSSNGSVYIFKLKDGNWIEQSPKIISSDASDGGLFGGAVDIWGDNAIAGDISANFDTVSASGMAYFYEGICTQGVGIQSLFSSDKESTFIYPNPVNNQLNILPNPHKEPFSVVTVFDLQGKKVLTKRLLYLQTEINVSDLPKGIYVISQTFASGVTRQQRLIKAFSH